MTDNFKEAARVFSQEYVPLTYDLNGKQIGNDLVSRYLSYIGYNCKKDTPFYFSYEAADNQAGLQIVSFNSAIQDVSLFVEIKNNQVVFAQHSVLFNGNQPLIPVIITVPSQYTCFITPDKDLPVVTIYAIRCIIESPIVIHA